MTYCLFSPFPPIFAAEALTAYEGSVSRPVGPCRRRRACAAYELGDDDPDDQHDQNDAHDDAALAIQSGLDFGLVVGPVIKQAVSCVVIAHALEHA
jgi:hypothetical protein